MIPFEHIELTDITTTSLYLHDGVSYAVRGWAPRIAVPQTSELAGSGPYAPVEESMTLDVFGDSAQNCIDNLARLNTLLQQARRWHADENISPVHLRVKVQDGTINASPYRFVNAVIWEPSGDTPPVVLEPVYDTDLARWVIRDVEIRFTRQGLWIGTVASTAGASTAPINENTITAYTDLIAIDIPHKITIAGFNGTTTPTLPESYWFIGPTGQLSAFATSTIGAGPAAYTVVADVANLAFGGSVLRYTPTGTTSVETTGIGASPGINSINQATHVFVKARSSTTARAWTIRALIRDSTVTAVEIKTPPYVWVPASTNPTMLYLGALVGNVSGYAGFDIAVDSIAGGPTLDVESAMYVQTKPAPVFVLATQALSIAGNGDTSIVIDHHASLQRVRPYPTVTAEGTRTLYIPYSGDPYIALRSPTLPTLQSLTPALVWFATNSNYWRFTNTANAVVNTTVTWERSTSYLTPQ